MAAIVSGSSLGLLNSSLYALGSQGALGQATQGRSGEQVFVNGSSGNLVIQNRDELVIGRGPDLSLLRTYNSQGLLDGDNNDNWRFGVYRKVTNLTGTVNTAGSTVTRVAEDGSESVYTFDATLGKYVCHDGGGSFDTLTFTSATQTWTWSWTDGTNQLTELYDNANGGRITKAQDQDGNALTFTYNAGLITQVTDANGETTFLDYSGTDLTQLRTVTADTPAKTIIRTRYAYDASHRLITVTTDLTPDITTDASTYVVNYTYDGTSNRVASLTQTDGNNLSFAYIQVGTAFNLASYTDAAGKTTSISHTQSTGSVPAPLVSSALTTPAAPPIAYAQGNWSAPPNPASTVTVTYNNAQAAGNLNVIAIGWNNSTSTITSVVDSKGNVYTRAIGPTISSGNATASIYYAKNIAAAAAGSNTVTVTFSAAVPFPDVRIAEYSGIDTVNPLDKAVGASGSGTSTSSGSVTTTNANDLIIGANFVANSTTGPGTGYTQRLATSDSSILEDKTVTATGSYSATAPQNASGWWVMQLVAFKRATSGTPYYNVPSEASWQSIANATYGVNSPAAGTALQTALGNPALTLNAHLTGFQATLNVPTQVTVRTDITDPLGLVTSILADGQGQITQILAPAVGGVRQSVSYAYDANGNVASVTDALGLVTTYGYDASGNRILERDAAGNTITRVFSASNLLLAETSYLVPDPDGAGAGQPGTPLTARYVYDSLGHLRFTVSAEGRVTEYRYNSFGQRSAAIQYTGSLYNLTGLTPTSTLTETQLTTTFVNGVDKTRTERVDSTYDFRGQLATTTSYTSVDASGNGVADGSQSVARYTYDQAGNLLNTVDGRGSSTTYVYDGLGRLRQTTDATGRITTSVYDDLNKKTVLTSANGLLTTSTYDAKGELISVMQSAIPEGVLGTTSYFYDADGRLRRTVDPTGISTHILYDDAGRRIATIDGTGTLTEYRYDLDNNLTRTIQYATAVSAANLASLVDAQGNPTNVALAALRPAATAQDRSRWNAYDSSNQLVKSVDELGYVTQMLYDGAGRTTDVLKSAKAMASTAALGDTPTPASINPAATDPLDRLTRNFYDADGKLRGTLDGEGYLAEYKYDAAGQLVETVGYATVTSAGSRATGTLAQLIPTPTPSDPNDVHSYALYNAKGQLIGQIDGEGHLTETVYDAAGNKSQAIRYANKVIYSAGATLTSLRPATSVRDEVTTYTYTALNQLDSATDALGTRTKYSYDSVGNLTQTVIAQNAGDARTLNAQYDKQGRLAAEFSGANIATNYTYDANGRRTSVTDRNGSRTLFYYDADGRLTHTIDALGEVTESGYNALGQITQRIAYAARLSGATLTGLSGGLVNSTLTGALAAIANAALDSTTTYSYTLRGQVASTTDPLNQSTTSFTYDADGDLVVKTEAVGKPEVRNTRYVYDHDDRLVYTVDASGGVTKNEYDAESRLTRTIAYTTALSNFATLPATPTAGDVTSRLTLSSSDQALTHVYDRDGREVYTIDALGDVTQRIYDAAGNVVERIGYARPIPAGTAATIAAVSAAVALVSDPAHDNNVRLVYDTTNRLVYSIDGLGEVMRNDYDARDNVIRTTSYDKALTAAQLTGLGPNPTIANVQSLVVANTAVDRIEQRVFDADDRLVYKIDALGFVEKTDYDALGQVIRTTRYAQAIPVSTPATLGGVAAALAANANRVGVRGLNLTGVAGTFASTPDTAANSLTGDIDIRVQAQLNSWVGTQGLFGKWTEQTNQRSYVLIVQDDGTLELDFSANGSSGVIAGRSTAATGFANNAKKWVRATLDRDDGLGHRVVKFYVSDDGTTWTQLGSTVTTAGAASLFDGTAKVEIGSWNEGTQFPASGKIYYAELRNGIDGTVAAKFNPADAGDSNAQSFVSSSTAHETWTLSGAATLDSPSLTENRVDTFAYDAAGRLIYRVDAHGEVTRNDYDANGNLIKTTGYATLVGISSLGTNPTVTSIQSQVAANVALDHVEQRVFDADNRLVYKIDALGFVDKTDYDALGQVIRTTRYAQAIPVSTPATLGVVAAALAANAARVDVRGMNLPGTAGSYASTPDSSANSVTGDIDLRVLLTHDTWAPASWEQLIAKDDIATNRDYSLRLGNGSTGKLQFVSSRDGSNATNVESTAATGFAPGSTHWVRVTRSAATGEVKFYTSDNYNPNAGPETWTQLGATLATTPGAIHDGTSILQLGSRNAASPDDLPFKGKIYYAEARNGIGGAVAAKFNPADAGDSNAQSFVSSSSAHETWTLNGAAVLDPASNVNYVDTAVYDAAGHLVYKIDAFGDVTRNDYDAAGDVTRTTDYATPLAISGLGANPTAASIRLQVSATPTLDRVEQRVLDAGGRLAFGIDAAGFVTQRTYDGNGNVTQEVRYANALKGTFAPGVAPQIFASTPQVPPSGAYVVADALDRTTRTVYDAANRPVFLIDAAGFVTQRSYDTNGNLTREVRYANPLQGTFTSGVAPQIVTSAPANGSYVILDPAGDRAVRSDYDLLGRAVARTTADATADASTQRSRFDAFGNEIASVDPRGVDLAERDTDWAKAERLRLGYTVTVLGVARAKLASELTAAEKASLSTLYTTAQAFDSVNRKLGTTDPLGNTSRTDYDAFGNAVRAIDPNGNAGYLYYDQRNLLVAQIDPAGDLTEYGYDAAGNKIRTIRYVRAVSMAHDAATPLASLRAQAGGVQDEVTRTTYDTLGRATQIVDAEGHAELFGYDRNTNNVSFHQDKNGFITRYDYDVAGNKTADRLTMTSWETEKLLETDDRGDAVDARFAYDALGNGIAVWTQSDGTRNNVYWNRYVAATNSWQGAQLLENDDSGNVSGPSIVMDSQGNATAVWQLQNNTSFRTDIYARRFVAGAWQTIQQLEAAGFAAHPQVAVDTQGNAIAVWDTALGDRKIYAARFIAASGTWQAARIVPNNTAGFYGNGNNQIAMDSQGNAILVFVQGDGPTGSISNIYASRYVAATDTWQTAQLLETDDRGNAFHPQVVVDSQGNALAVWDQSDPTGTYVYANRFVAATSTWQGVQVLSAAAGSSPRTAFDRQGNAMVVWQGAGVFANRYVAATGTWQGPQLLDSLGSGPNIAFDSQGNATAVWSRAFGADPVTTQPLSQVVAARYMAGSGTWQSGQPVSDGTGSAQRARIVFDARDNATVTWDQQATIQRFSILSSRLVATPVVNRYEYDAFGNKTKDILAAGLDEQRVTQYVYDRNGRLVDTLLPQEPSPPPSAPAPAGSLQVSGGPVNYEFALSGQQSTAFRDQVGVDGFIDHDVPYTVETVTSSLVVSWPPVIGYGDGAIKVVWKTGASDENSSPITLEAATADPSARSLTLRFSSPPVEPPVPFSNRFLNSTEVYEVDVYKQQAGGDDVLLTSVVGSYFFQSNDAGRTVGLGTIPSTFHFTGQPPTGQSMHVAYWPASDPNDITEVDLKSYAAGTFSGFAQGVLSGSYGYEAKVFDANGDALSAVIGTFSAAAGSATAFTIQAQPLSIGAPPPPHVPKAYDAAGNLIRQADANGNSTYFYYDANNRLVGTVNAERYLQRLFYDAAGNVIAERTYGDPIPGSGDLPALPDPAAIVGMNPANFREIVHRYDADNRQTEADTQSVLVYDRTSAPNPRSQALVTQRRYDRNGNLVLETDANGNKTYTYYDKADRKIAQVDALNYLTTWAYDAAGNMTGQARYAAPLTGTVTAASDPAALALQAAQSSTGQDRICLYDYDRMNRQIRETTQGVQFAGAMDENGVPAETVGDVVVRQRYDAMGNLIARIQDTAETDYLYDQNNRLVLELDPTYLGAFASARGSKAMTYDAVGNVKQVNDNGSITSYEYDPQGHVTREIDPLGNPTRYFYDLNGNIAVKHVRHVNPDGTVSGIDSLYTYDNLNRQTSATEARNFTDYVRYDAYGEIVAKGRNKVEFEYEEYDKAGRLIKTNKDDGVNRAYLYDANGNQTAMIQSAIVDTDLKPLGIAQIANLSAAIVQRTESAYDARNQLTATYQAPITPTPGPGAQEVFVDALGDAFLGGTVTAMQGGTASYVITETLGDRTNTLSHLDVSWPPIVGYGDGNIKIVWNTGNSFLGSSGFFTHFANKDATSAHLTGAEGEFHGASRSQQALPPTYSISIYKQTVEGDVLITGVSGSGTGLRLFPNTANNDTSSTTVTSEKSVLHFTGQRTEAQSLRVWLWPVGKDISTATVKVLHPLTTAGVSSIQLLGHFVLDLPANAAGPYNYEFKTYASADGTGADLDYVKGVTRLGGPGAQLLETGSARAADVRTVFDAQGNGIAVWAQSDGVRDNVYWNRYVAATNSWQGAQLMENDDSANAFLPSIAMDSQGDATVVWHMQNGTVYAQRFVAGAWQASLQLAINGASAFPQVAVDAQGNAMAVWAASDRKMHAARFVAASGSGGASGIWKPDQIIPINTAGSLGSSQVAIDAQGNALLVFSQIDDATGVSSIYSSRYVAQVNIWRPAQLVETDNRGNAFDLRLAMDGQGNAMAVWDQSDPTGTYVYANVFTSLTETWRGAQALSTAAGLAPRAAFDGQGNAIVVWTGWAEGVFANRYVAPTGFLVPGTWQGPQLLDGRAVGPDIAFDSLGNATAVWSRTDGSKQVVAARSIGGSGPWSAPQPVSDGASFVQAARIVFDAQNNANITWEQLDSNGVSSLVATRIPAQGFPSKLVRTLQEVNPARSSDLLSIARSQSYNAFGEVVQEKDAAGHITDLTYNTRGDLIQKVDPKTSYTDNHGLVQNFLPTTRYYYDYLGRTVGTMDPNLNMSTQRFDAAGHLLTEYHADGGKVQYAYDGFGNMRSVTKDIDNGIVERTSYRYDAKKQLTQVDHPTDDLNFANAARYDKYGYDEAGRRISHTNALDQTDLTYYDSTGRVTQTTNAAGIATRYRYVYDAASGGTRSITTEQSLTLGPEGLVPRTLEDTKDYFGRLLKHVDLNGRPTTYTYNEAGWLIRQQGAKSTVLQPGTVQNFSDISFTYYRNGLLKGTIDNVLGASSKYEYDQNGNRTFEGYARTTGVGVVYDEWSKAQYDELNRITRIDDPAYNIAYEYDKVGNRRHVHASFTDGLDATVQTQDYWYDYDKMNRFTVTQGVLADAAGNLITVQNPLARPAGTIVAGATGSSVSYNKAGERAQVGYVANGTLYRETFSYAVDGLLTNTLLENVGGAPTGAALFADIRTLVGSLSSSTNRTYDLVGDVKTYTDSGGRHSTYEYRADGKLTKETNTATGESDYYYDRAGDLFSVLNLQGGTTVRTSYQYDYWDTAKQSAIRIQAQNNSVLDWKPGFSSFTYDANGHLAQVVDVAGNRSLRYASDAHGLVLQRNELIGSQQSRTQFYYYFNGVGVGDAGSFGPSRTDYASLRGSASDRSADFDYNYTPISDRYPATTPGTYAIQPGDVGSAYDQTLRNIAQAVWGDGSMWYILADANGLTATSVFQVGQVLVIPNVVTNVHNSASTFQVYDAGERIGDVSPTLPDPPPPPQPSQGGCGGMGLVLMVVVAVVVTIYTAGAAAALLGGLEIGGLAGAGTLGMAVMTGAGGAFGIAGAAAIAGAAIGGAVGSIASQRVGMWTGNVDKFSWTNVGLAAIGAGVTAGLGGTNLAGTLSNGMVTGDAALAANAAFGNSLTQQIARGTGYQDGFNWRSVAVSAIAAPIAKRIADFIGGDPTGKVSGGIPERAGTDYSRWAGDFGTRLTTSLATGVATQALRRRYNNGQLDYAQIAADAFGNTLAEGLARSGRQPQDIFAEAAQRGAERMSQAVRSGASYADAGSVGNTMRDVSGSPDRLSLQGGDGAEADTAAYNNLMKENTLIVNEAAARGESLAPTAANAMRLGLQDPGYLLGSASAGGLALQADMAQRRAADFLTNLPSMDTPTSAISSESRWDFLNRTGISSTLYDSLDPNLPLPMGPTRDRAAIYQALEQRYQAIVRGQALEAPPIGPDDALLLGAAGAKFAIAGGKAVLGMIGKDAAEVVANRVPLGLKQAGEFEAFGGSLYSKLEAAGFGNVDAAFQGSSVTGRSYRPPHSPFDVGRVSDFDIAISSPELFQKAQSVGVGLRQQGTRTGPLSLEKTPGLLERMGLTDVSKQLASEAGRPVNFMIYRSIDDAVLRSPSIVVPRPR